MRSTCMSPSSAIKMATFNAKAFEKKLNAMDLSQTSIQTVSLWIIHHRQSIREVTAVWTEMMKKGNGSGTFCYFSDLACKISGIAGRCLMS